VDQIDKRVVYGDKLPDYSIKVIFRHLFLKDCKKKKDIDL